MIKKISKDFIWNVIGSSFNAFNSLFFMMIVTRINGMNDAGIFSFAFSTACLFYIIGIYSGRTYQVTDDNEKISDSDYIHSRFFSCSIMVILSIVFCLLRQYNLYKSIVIVGLVIYKAFESFSEAVYAIIQEQDQLYKVGISMFIKAIISLILFLITDYLFKNIILSILFIGVVNLLVILIYDIKNIRKLNFKLEKLNFKKVWMIFKFGFFAFAFSILTQYVINAPKYSIDTLLSNSDQTIFGIIFMPATIIILLGQFILQPFLLRLKMSLKENKKDFLKLTILLSIAIAIVGTIFLIFMYFFGTSLLKILYNVELNMYLNALVIIIIGGIFYGVSLLLSTSLTTLRSTFSQLLVFIIVTMFSYFIANYLVSKNEILGASYAYMYSMLLLLILYIITFSYVLKKYRGDKK